MAKKNPNRYERLLEHVFLDNYVNGASEVTFSRVELEHAAKALDISLPKNLGDVIYSVRYRNDMPAGIAGRAPKGKAWQIMGKGSGRYSFVALDDIPLTPNPHMGVTKVPDSTPGMISKYALTSEQALLAKVRYNRLIDLFTGVVCFSLQNHLKTTVASIGQVETDEVYVGVDKSGTQFVIPVEAKGGNDRLSIVQLMQDLALCKEKFPDLECRIIGAQFVGSDVALFLFKENPEDPESVVMVEEKHYRLVPPDQISPEELHSYRMDLQLGS